MVGEVNVESNLNYYRRGFWLLQLQMDIRWRVSTFNTKSVLFIYFPLRPITLRCDRNQLHPISENLVDFQLRRITIQGTYRFPGDENLRELEAFLKGSLRIGYGVVL
jgi:hypothetical protein